MSYRVAFSPEFGDNVRSQIEYLREQHVSEERINQWFGELFERLETLSQSPKRHPLDPIQSESTGQPSHKLVYDKYLVFYRVDDTAKTVNIDQFTHGARDRGQDHEQNIERLKERETGGTKGLNKSDREP